MTKTAQEPWYLVSDTGQLDSPALLFYPDRIAENIRRLISSIDDINRLRPHIKTHKNLEITAMMLDAGISKFKCATIAEAEMLAIAGAGDVLLAYQPVGPNIRRFLTLIRKYPRTGFSCLVDHAGAAGAIAGSALQEELEVPVWLDLNVGMNRTGILPGHDALQFYLELSRQSGLTVKGLHAYDGHIHAPSLPLRREQWNTAWEQVSWLNQAIFGAGLKRPLIVAGGTPTYPFYAALPEIECSPGTFVLWDKGYQEAFAEQDYLPAALVMSRVVSLTSADSITVDLGHKSVAAENPLDRRVFFLNAPAAVPVSQSEEHLVLHVPAGHGFNIGDVLYGLPVHICPTVALYSSATTLAGGRAVERWKIIARERKISV